jgi:maltose/maltodextrin transport permease
VVNSRILTKKHKKLPSFKRKLSPGEKTFEVINIILLVGLAITMVYPMYYIVVLSFSDGVDALKGGIWLFPRVFTLDNYKQVFANKQLLTAFVVSVVRTVVGTAVSVILIAMMAYALCRKDLPGRRALNKFFFFTTIFSGGMIPTISLLNRLQLLDNPLVYVLPAIYSFYNMLLIRTSFEATPVALREAALMDGVSEWKIFWKVYMPLNKPVLATVALFTAVFHWNDWFAGSYYISTDWMKPAATILQEMLSEALGNLSNASATGGAAITTTAQTLQMAFVVVITFPIMVVYPFLQKYFTKGAVVGSIKE